MCRIFLLDCMDVHSSLISKLTPKNNSRCRKLIFDVMTTAIRICVHSTCKLLHSQQPNITYNYYDLPCIYYIYSVKCITTPNTYQSRMNETFMQEKKRKQKIKRIMISITSISSYLCTSFDTKARSEKIRNLQSALALDDMDQEISLTNAIRTSIDIYYQAVI